ncbi:MAG TPA: M13 family metallopeptidase N-terminal domain-containing protein, partial [Gemmatimonadaceae bacterium]|nr:M13 family metallopeptidase N-terminal domain-containing protein [Gemmatimonadaceae bacterium]
MRQVLCALALTLGLATSAAAQNAVPIQSTPLDPANLDRSVSACTDFYQFANGGWVKNNPVPAAFSRWGSFDQLAENNQGNLLTILRAASANGNTQANEDIRKLGVFYSSCMDSVGAERAGAQPIKAELDRINAVKN